MSKRKSHNPNKRKLALTNAITLQYLKSKGQEVDCNMPRMMFDIAISLNRPWIIEVIIYCQDHNGNQYQETGEIRAYGNFNDITEAYKTLKNDLLNKVNPNHIVDEGWIAKPLTARLKRQLDQLDELESLLKGIKN